jgi:hypothetical protein
LCFACPQGHAAGCSQSGISCHFGEAGPEVAQQYDDKDYCFSMDCECVLLNKLYSAPPPTLFQSTMYLIQNNVQLIQCHQII